MDKSRSLRVRILGELPDHLIPEQAILEKLVPLSGDAHSGVTVRDVIRDNRQPKGSPPLFFLTSHDLFLPGCRSLFGYASHRDQVAIISTHHLVSNNPKLLQTRLANVIAHESGHLEGLCHCTTPKCLMNPAQNVEDLDLRSIKPCGHCPRSSKKPLRMLVALAVFISIIAAVDASAALFKVSKQPFYWQTHQGDVALFFKETPLLSLGNDGNSSAPLRAESITQSLNRLFLQIHPPPVEVVSQDTDGAIIKAGETTIMKVLPSDATGGSTLQVAQQWAGRIDPLIRGKGFATESCPGCHINRMDQIDYELRNKGKLRR